MKIHITDARKKRGWNRSRLAREAKTSPATITRLEDGPRGKLEPSSGTLLRLAAALKVKPQDLEFGVDGAAVETPEQEKAAS